ncbi:alpha/beta fold hydrolase [Ferrovibrio sp.]|uniref:alpha/beta hydrolase n=1 Tax=Ferrovibrio sp. TaxID=1917215 RepID=UPI001B6D7F52|nr:alpha/beta fold hydrolase [Ferrovibrio sp.]MBP7063463.1 alpha/beta fold hydrolase [Ferrovibrio sp.]
MSLRKISTNVRNIIKLGSLRLGYRLGFALAPGLAAEQAARLFLKPQRQAPTWLPEPQEHAPARNGPTAFRLLGPQGELFAWSWGSGPTVLVVHGWEDDHRGLTPLIDRLTWAGFRVVALDLPGHGKSAAASGGLAPIPVLAEAVAAVARLVGPLEAIVAHSLGGTATMLALSELGVDARRAVILASPNHPEHFARGVARLLGLGDNQFSRMRAAIERLAGRPLDALHLPPLLRRLNLPALFLHDAGDRVVPLQHSRDNAAAWHGARLEVLHGLGHRRLLADPQVLEQVVGFVADTTPQSRAMQAERAA